jgi:hypothetical protein
MHWPPGQEYTQQHNTCVHGNPQHSHTSPHGACPRSCSPRHAVCVQQQAATRLRVPAGRALAFTAGQQQGWHLVRALVCGHCVWALVFGHKVWCTGWDIHHTSSSVTVGQAWACKCEAQRGSSHTHHGLPQHTARWRAPATAGWFDTQPLWCACHAVTAAVTLPIHGQQRRSIPRCTL